MGELLVFGTRYERQLAVHRVARPIYLLLVGAAFSLWRAAFLSENTKTWKGVVRDATKTIERLVQDNAIGYPQDRETRHWMSGYYLNSAKWRLLTAWHRHLKPNTSAAVLPESIRKVELSDAATITGMDTDPPTDTWDTAHSALVELLGLLQALVK